MRFLTLMIAAAAISASAGNGIELRAGGAGYTPVYGVLELSNNLELLTGAHYGKFKFENLHLGGVKMGEGFKIPVELRYETPMKSMKDTNFLIGNTLLATYGYVGQGHDYTLNAGYILNLGISKPVHKNAKVIMSVNTIQYHGDTQHIDYVWTVLSGASVGFQMKF
tara:strand:- start:1759 stop:2256 length:498 start_codon:yes stop_codon:yes gene_type:complete